VPAATNSRIGSKLAWVAALAALLVAGAASAAEVVKMRMGNHPTYTRVVFELDSAAGYRFEKRETGEGAGEIVVTLDAVSHPKRIDWKTVMVEDLSVEPQGERAVARIELKKTPSRVREMMLAKPPRIVLDLVFPEADLARVRARAKALEVAKAREAAEAEKVQQEVAPDADSVARAGVPAVPSQPKPRDRAAIAKTPPSSGPSRASSAQAATTRTGASRTASARPAEPKAAKPPETAKRDTPETNTARALGKDPKGLAAKPNAKSAAAAKPDPVATVPTAKTPAAATTVLAAKTSDAEAAEARPAQKGDAEVAEVNERPEPTRRSALTRPDEKPSVADPGKPAEGSSPAGQAVARSDTDPSARPDTAPPIRERRSTEKRRVADAAPNEPAQAATEESGDSNMMVFGGVAGGLLLLLVAVLMLRRRSALPNDLDVTAVAEEQGRLDSTPDGGFAFAAEPAAEEEAELVRAPIFDENPAPEPTPDPVAAETRPVEVDIAAGPGLFDEDDTEKESETMDLESHDLPVEQTASELPTQLGIGAAEAGDSDIARLVRDLERRVVQLETRLDESTDARERLERQMAAQAEELRVQRAAIARTQRALRSLNRPGDEQATEPALREPS